MGKHHTTKRVEYLGQFHYYGRQLTGKTQYLEDVDEVRSKFGFELRGRSDGQLVIGADIGPDETRVAGQRAFKTPPFS